MTSRCQCPFSGPADTILGCHRDPITSEKGWLDFAVRELSRVAAGKDRGQEAVWRSQCKPVWWDYACNHPWKNPTANPKDSKDTLKAKFECLVQHLRKEGQLPKEMVEEIRLWEDGHVSEVFLMTYFSSLLGQATNLHSVLLDADHKMENAGISVAPSILTDLQSCLSACTDKIETIKMNQKGPISKPVNSAGNKRVCDEKDSAALSQPPCKRSKHSPSAAPQPLCKRPKLSPSSSSPLSSSLSPNLALPPSSSNSSSSSSSPPSACPTLSPSVFNSSVSAEQPKLFLAVLQKQLLQKKAAESAAIVAACQTSKPQTQLKPKVHPIPSSRKQRMKKTRVQGMGQGNVATADDVSVSTPLSVCLSAATPQYFTPDVPVENAEFTDFLELDLGGNDDVADCQFLDSLLQDASTDITVDDSTTTPSCSVAQTAACPVPACNSVTSPLHIDATNPLKFDPIFVQTPTACSMSENAPFHSNIPEAVSDRQTEGGDMEKDIGTTLFPGVGDMDVSIGLQDTEVVSDSGYNSESSVATSHRSSFDSDTYSYSDLNSPDLEALLDSL